MLTFSVIMLTTGMITGWWLHEKLAISRKESQQAEPEMILSIIPPAPGSSHSSIFDLESKPQKKALPPSGEEDSDFIQALNEERFDDALIIYQQTERTRPGQHKNFREALEKWLEQQSSECAVKGLVRFTHHYYQDEKLLNLLASHYEKLEKLDISIETLLDLRGFTFKEDELKKITARIRSLSKELFYRSVKQGQLGDLGYLFQRLSAHEPEFSFYRFALSQVNIALGNTESAIYDLEILQLDPEFGRQATRNLAALLPPPAPEESEELPSANVPLLSRNGHYIIRVSAGTKESVPLLIDTGASLTTLPSELLQRLRRKKLAARVGHTHLRTAGGTQFAPIYQIKELHIGNFVVRNLQVAELDLFDTDSQGLLGMDVLGQFRFQLDQDRSILTLQQRW